MTWAFAAVAMVLAVGTLGVTTLGTAAAATTTHFSISVPSGVTAGNSFSITVSALDSTNAIDTTYAGTVVFSSSDGNAVLPANSTLANGTGTFTATFDTSGSQTITATDDADSGITGTSNVTVTASAATQLVFSAPSTATQGTAFSYTVTAEDQFGNVDKSYSGTISFASTDPAATLPGDSTLSDGTGSFSATLNTTGDQRITSTDKADDSITGTSDAIAVSAATVTTTTPTATAEAPVEVQPTFTG